MLASPVILGGKAMQCIQWLIYHVWEKIPNAALVAATAERIIEAGMRLDRCPVAMNMHHPETDSALFNRDSAESRGVTGDSAFYTPLAASVGAV